LSSNLAGADDPNHLDLATNEIDLEARAPTQVTEQSEAIENSGSNAHVQL
jgi:hypothetical protein